MKKYILCLQLFVFANLFLSGCNTATPEKYFNVAILNTNKLAGFANDGQLRQLESPSVKLSEANGKVVPMTRSDEINSQIEFVEANLEDLNSLKETEETKEMLAASKALYEYVLPVYKNEYTQLAKLYDNGASKDQIELLANSIQDKYYPGYIELSKKLVSFGKIYAEKNNIKVNWDIRTSPR